MNRTRTVAALAAASLIAVGGAVAAPAAHATPDRHASVVAAKQPRLALYLYNDGGKYSAAVGIKANYEALLTVDFKWKLANGKVGRANAVRSGFDGTVWQTLPGKAQWVAVRYHSAPHGPWVRSSTYINN